MNERRVVGHEVGVGRPSPDAVAGDGGLVTLPTTEWPNPASAGLDELPTLGVLRVMNEQDRLVPAAVRAELGSVAQAVDAIADRLGQGGRLVYLGAGTSGRLAVMEAA